MLFLSLGQWEPSLKICDCYPAPNDRDAAPAWFVKSDGVCATCFSGDKLLI